LWRDESFVVLRKPAGIHVHPSPLSPGEASVLEALRDHLGQWVYPLHRLDRATFGLLIFALNPEAARAGCAQFAQRKVYKEYRALVRGWLSAETLEASPLGSKPRSVSKEAQEAQASEARPKAAAVSASKFEVSEAYLEDERACSAEPSTEKPQNSSLFIPIRHFLVPEPVGKWPQLRLSELKVVLKGGKRHQIRRHAARLAYPVLGDTSYGCRHHNHWLWERFPGFGLQLWAKHLEFEHPYSREILSFEDSLPEQTHWLGPQLETFELKSFL